jgi:hypothetical protein
MATAIEFNHVGKQYRLGLMSIELLENLHISNKNSIFAAKF